MVLRNRDKMWKNNHQSEKLLIQFEEDDAEAVDQHPSCPHGPTILFYGQSQKPNQGYYACSAHRDGKHCTFYMPASEWKGESPKREPTWRNHPHQDTVGLSENRDPTLAMQALDQEAVHAQYFFDADALTFLADQCRLLEITKVVCMGAPRLHFHLRDKFKDIKSFLLDLDERFASYLGPKEFCLYNMCNNHFLYSHEPFKEFLQCSITDRVLIVTDPPFGCRTELIAHTLHSLRLLHNRVNQIPLTPLNIFWIYPYFHLFYIRQQMPEMEMSDYKFNYTNHARYTNVGKASRSQGSPVRLFTNVPLDMLYLTSREGYKYCEKCRKHTSANWHCDLCQKCSSINGQTYRHCPLCDTCVKPFYVHCPNCRRCTQKENHECSFYETKQICKICGNRGHIETKCKVLEKLKLKRAKRFKSTQPYCLLCGHKDHREQRCKQRVKYFKETDFMGKKLIELK